MKFSIVRQLYIKISKTLSYILRHHPEQFNIQLDSNGFTDFEVVLKILNEKYKEIEITNELVKKINKISDKKRFEIKENKIRAIYGHSITEKIEIPEALNPPNKLYHGTIEKAYLSIKQEGLKKVSRQYVHLSSDIETAIIVGKRRVNNPIILEIDVESAKKEGIKFYKSDEIYLADYVPPKFISIHKK